MRQAQEVVTLGAPVPSLIRWGCSPDADLVYRTLVTLGPRTGRELRRELGMAGRRAVDAIDELVAVAAIAPRAGSAGAGATWEARPPAEVVPILRRVRSRRVAHPTGRRGDGPPVGLQEPCVLGDGLRHLASRALTRERLAELAEVASGEHLAMNSEEVFDAGSVRAAVPVDRRMLSRGVRMRVLGVQAPAPDPFAPYGRLPAERLPDYRQALVVPMKLFVVDRKVALFPVDPRDFERGYLEVAQAPIVSALVALFERHWERAWDPWEDAMRQTTLSARERALVCLLAQGHTDVTAARELGLSPRSVSTILRQLMDRFQVDNRFQLGLALGALRVVPPPRPAMPLTDGEHDDQT